MVESPGRGPALLPCRASRWGQASVPRGQQEGGGRCLVQKSEAAAADGGGRGPCGTAARAGGHSPLLEGQALAYQRPSANRPRPVRTDCLPEPGDRAGASENHLTFRDSQFGDSSAWGTRAHREPPSPVRARQPDSSGPLSPGAVERPLRGPQTQGEVGDWAPGRPHRVRSGTGTV